MVTNSTYLYKNTSSTNDKVMSFMQISPNKVFTKKKVFFSTGVSVILIPTRKEYFETGLGESLWWANCDYANFKKTAVTEFRAMLAICNMDSKAALEVIFKSNNDYSASAVNNNESLVSKFDEYITSNCLNDISNSNTLSYCTKRSLSLINISIYEFNI